MTFDESFLEEMGLSEMPEDDKPKFLEYIQSELETRIGKKIAANLTDMQLDQFNLLTEQEEISDWLERNCPNYREVVSETIDEMKAAIAQNRDRLLSGSPN
ncbi:MAG: DUF5663 domain-containing protein [Candidatus Saccharibacteria bacterium]|nr:DUF5663 domain-containing protein [Candidatus Saccharibacteria bacterium]